MGKNIYETPRDRNKWNTGHDRVDKHPMSSIEEPSDRLEMLKKRFSKQQNKKKSKS